MDSSQNISNEAQRISEILSLQIHTIRHSTVTIEWGGKFFHTDPYARLYFITRGKAKITLKNQEVNIGKNYLVLIPTHTPLLLQTPIATLNHFWIHFTPQLTPGTSLFDLYNFPYTILLKSSDTTREKMRTMLKLYNSSKLGDAIRIQALLREVLSLFIDRAVPKSPTQSLKDIGEIQPALDYIEKNLQKNMSLKELSKTLHLSANYFSDKFKKTIGVSPQEYICRKRVEKAQMLLLNSDLTVKAIAAQIGYDDEFYFSRMFTKRIGASPGSYRRRVKDRIF